MLHSRGFVPTENQAFTPGPSRALMSPSRRAATTGKRALGQKNHLLGQESGAVGPKQLFNDLMSNKTPAKALGDRNASKTPGPSKLGAKSGSPSKHGSSSPTKGLGENGKNSASSPAKKAAELSPRKASTSNALRTLNGKQKQHETDLPFAKQAMMTPAPSELGQRLRTMSRQSSFVTPAANVGRAGQIKARMGEMMDAELGLSLQKGDVATEQSATQQVRELTEEEMYPEIEYMPPSHYAKHPVFEFPEELDGLPRAKELGEQLIGFCPFELKSAGPEDLSDVEPGAFSEQELELDLEPPRMPSDGEGASPVKRTSASKGLTGATGSRLRSVSAKVTSDRARTAPSAITRPTAFVPRSRIVSAGSSSGKATTSQSSDRLNPTAKSGPSQTVRSTGLQRSIAAVPRTRPNVSLSASARSSASQPTTSQRGVTKVGSSGSQTSSATSSKATSSLPASHVRSSTDK